MRVVGVLASLATPAAAWAARTAKSQPSGAPELKASVPIWAILCALVALAGICVVAFKNARRTHLD